jgi:hypothetical protein
MPTAAGRSKKRFPGAFFTTCDWADKFCDGRDWGTVCWLVTEENLCARHYCQTLREETN